MSSVIGSETSPTDTGDLPVTAPEGRRPRFSSNAFRSLAVAMWKGFVRDRAAVFFTLFFPLFFIIIFGTVFTDGGTAKGKIALVGDVSVIQQLPPDAKAAIDKTLELKTGLTRDEALHELRKDDLDGVLEQHGNRLELKVSNGDQVGAATVQGVLGSVVDSTNIAVTGQQPRYTLSSSSVQDESLKAIQYVTPGMIGYGIAVGATFGAATTLVEWRKRKVLRRLRLAPVPTSSIVTSRVAVSLAIALFQLAVFVGVGMVLGLRLTGSWYMAVPLTLCGTLAFLSIGLFCGSVAKSSEAAVGMANLITLPMGFLSGAFIPLEAAPGWIQAIAKVLPMGWLVQGLKDTMVRGEGPAAAILPMLLTLGFAAAVTLVATRFFSWEDS
ncbi:ABC transporter permease [Luteipulveratus sp. YIM 133132]|uniref:ABC transporter permease n=1 Tax=Luteipulveratus flavus TaxID=3031728 RepID=UPI0023AF263D|nr:ABC transporter permease [Luteipulveratus sp. YIM 133132]MDE9364896.1 ABC transporter permease [Luteipulveratus sp. YIM 133132]